MLRNKIPLVGAIPILLVVAGSLYWAVDSAAEGRVQKAMQGRVWSNADCLSCHTDAQTLKKMQDKRGDPTYCQAAYDLLTHAKSGTPKASSKYPAERK